MGSFEHGRGRAGDIRDHGAGRVDPQAPIPGKQTLAEQLPGGPIQRKSGGGEAHPSAPSEARGARPGWLEAAFGGGNALPPEVRSKMEHSFGSDFSAVRIHEGPQATAMGARAFAQGTDIHFAPGQYDPFSSTGQELLGHELAHVVQQSQGRVAATAQRKGVALNDDAALESEADQLGARAARGEAAHGGAAAVAPLPSMSLRPVQRHKTISEDKIPIQTDGNCGLFSILTAMRAFGFGGEVQTKAMTELDKMVKQSEDTFLGEIFTVTLMVQIVNGLKIDGEQILRAEPVAFDSQQALEELLVTYKQKDNVALLIGYSKPDEYDRYYQARGMKIYDQSVNDTKLERLLDDKVDVEDFKVKDAHWGMINEVSEDGFVDISDNISSYGGGKDHGYNTLMSTRKLYNSNTSLSQGEFDWSGYIDNDSVDYNRMNRDRKKTQKDEHKDLSQNKRYQGIQNQNMKEKLDLSGKLVVVTLTEQGTQLLKR